MDELTVRQQLVDASRQLQPRGLSAGTSGNLSVRWQQQGVAGMLITPSGIAYDTLVAEDIVFVDERGTYQHRLQPSSEWLMHLDVYRTRTEAQAVVHGHPRYGTVLAIRGMGIPPLHYMVAAAGGPDIRCATYATFGTPELSQAALQALEGRKACLLGNHGCLVFEASLSKAMWLAGEVETLAQQYVMSLLLGGSVLLPEDEIARVQAKFANYGLRSKSSLSV